MPEFTQLFSPGEAYTSTASTAVTGGNTLVVTGNDTVGRAAGVDGAFVGVAAFDAAAGQPVTVLCEGVMVLTASGAIARGDRVTTAANGAVAALGASTAYDTVIGVALAAAAGGTVKVKLIRG